jgi:ABC-type multidrug transport system fused ATPase/permease subunit
LHIFNKLSYLLQPSQKKAAVVLLVMMIIGMLLEVVSIGLVIPALGLMSDSNLVMRFPAIKQALVLMGHPTNIQLIAIGMLTLVFVFTIKALFLFFLAWKQSDFIFSLQASLSQRLFSGYLLQPFTFHLQRNSAQLIRNITGEIGILVNAMLSGTLLIGEILVLVGITILLFFVEPLGALLTITTFIFSGYTFHYLTKSRILLWGESRQFHDGQRIQHLQQGLGGVKEIKLLGREKGFLDQFSHHNNAIANIGKRQSVMQSLPRLWLEWLAIFGLAAMVLTILLQNKPLETLIPTIGLFAAAAFRLMPSVNRILNATQGLRYAQPAINMLYEEVRMLGDKFKSEKNLPVPFCKSIHLNNISYSYHEASVKILDNINLIIKRGSTVGFVGSSGAGKSTLIDIVLGLLTPTSGKLLVDGCDIQVGLRNWQNQIGYVPQSIYLTDDTLRHNVAFGIPEDQVNDQAVHDAIEIAHLTDYVASLPDGLNTMVGEQGVRISGGQRQRIGIARALYYDPKVLVLDEATSALDVVTEGEIMDEVTALRGSKTILIIAHRLTTVAGCDRLYRLKEGRLIEEGQTNE